MPISSSSFWQHLGHRIVSQTFSGRQKRGLLVSFVCILFVVRGIFLWGLITSKPVADAMNQYLAQIDDLASQVRSQLSGFSLTISDQGVDATSIIRIYKPSMMTGSLPSLLFVLDTRPDPQPTNWLGDDGNQALFVVTRSLLLINTGFLDPGPTYMPHLRLASFTTPVVLTQAIIEPIVERIGTRSERGRHSLITSMQRGLGLIWLIVVLMGGLVGGTVLFCVLYGMVICLRLLLRFMDVPGDRYDLGSIVLILFIPISFGVRLVGLHRGHQAGIVLLCTIGLVRWHVHNSRLNENKKHESNISLGSGK
ncbi:MAG: hypothetical protein NZL83_04245 [Candidatus Absconditabacterales bacterium]|nr:hypothetical protein [Candidatus Absconditabacterales bacterium]